MHISILHTVVTVCNKAVTGSFQCIWRKKLEVHLEEDRASNSLKKICLRESYNVHSKRTCSTDFLQITQLKNHPELLNSLFWSNKLNFTNLRILILIQRTTVTQDNATKQQDTASMTHICTILNMYKPYIKEHTTESLQKMLLG